MYFQLNNMPIFRGIYTIIKVNHKITPHNMTTTFTGNRIRAVKTPLLENETIYMNLIGSINSTSMTGQPDGKSGSGALNGRNTERWEEQGGYVTYEVTPNAGLVFQQTEPQNALGDSFAMKSVGVFMEQLALKWHAANNGKTQGSDKLYINCFGARGGGGKKSHSEKSLHYVGRAVDLRPMMKTKKVQKWHVGQSNYSSENNKKFIQMAIDLSDKNTYGVKLNNIILNDKALITHFSKIKNKDNKPLVFGNSDHNNHIHMEFEIPDDVVKMMEEAELEEQITSNAVDGQASEKTAERPKNPEEHLGKI